MVYIYRYRRELLFFKDLLVYQKTDPWRWHVGTSCEALACHFDPAQPVLPASPRMRGRSGELDEPAPDGAAAACLQTPVPSRVPSGP